ncbi:portal protein [Sphingopyxis flava]|uniref:Bacteriophage head to tail connecting protein n=1 Tax=Sphingopyxis flava TaxID=1507287 RepID=A0A1T5BS29_9SPHN|nr:portal protein [Sphingopyxis flava]SKB49640.1 Bacteriophage head to tail connecting protein [Sphingopyxis flava]
MAQKADGLRSGEAKTRYEQLKRARENVLTQAREAARLTIPGLVPAEGATDPHQVSEQPYTANGARFVNNLSAKLLLALFPPERPFFRLDIGPDVAEEMGAAYGEAQEKLADISRRAMVLAEDSASRTIWMETLRHLVVAGNALVYQPDDGTQMRMWRIDQFVVVRGRDGLLQEAVINDKIYPSELSEEVRAACNVKYDPSKPDQNDPVDLYTHIYLNGDRMEHYEEINGIEVPESRGSVERKSGGWQALRWQAVPGSDYGRAYVTEYAGDFLSLEDAHSSILKFAIEAARILRFVDPNAGIDVEEVTRAESGDFLTGMIDRVQTLQLDKNQDFQIVWNQAQSIERRLSQAFLIASNAIRDAERVTAEEIRAIAQELEDSLGGTYTVLSAEVQRPYASRLLYILSKQKKAPKLPESVSVVIVTGFNALGQNHESAALKGWLMDVRDALGEAWISQNLDGQAVALRLGVGRGVVDVSKLIKAAEDVAEDAQAGALTQAGISAAPQIAKGVIDAASAANQEGT